MNEDEIRLRCKEIEEAYRMMFYEVMKVIKKISASLVRWFMGMKKRNYPVRKYLRRLVERGKYKYGHGERKRAAKEAARCLQKK